ncbi:MAG: leucine-rich repeat protein [Alistipes sp.]|nr:leucine-rich repeat protein [Alistipes sp.]
MKKLFIYLLVAITMIIAGCSESFDDSKIWDKLDDHESRIAKLEELCKQMNTNISSLQTIVKALQNNDYVTGVTPITKDGETVGYTITFTKSQPITIYHGKDGKDGQNGADGKDGVDGKDGSTPIIGVKQDTDNIYYWTLNGEWLLDANGNKIKAQGTDGKDGQDGADGKDGITPQLKIENDYWYISYDNGTSWTQLSKATGEDGQDGANGANGDSFFQSVAHDENDVYITLADGTVIVLPKYSNLNISFSEASDIACLPGKNIKIDYTISCTDPDVHIATITQNGWQAVVTKESATAGYIVVTAPDPLTNSPIIVLVSDSNKTIMRTLSFVEGFAVVENASFTLTHEATTLNVNVQSNLNYSVHIPDTASSWITLEGVTTRAVVRNDIITLNIAENSEIKARSATLQLIFNGESVGTIEVYQQGIKGEIIEFKDSVVEKICLDKWDASGDGLLSVLEVAAVTNPNDLIGVFEGNASITSFNELKYFTGLTGIPSAAFKGCINLYEITLPQSIKSLGSEIFYDCKALSGIDIPTSITQLPSYCFYNCISLTNIILPNSIKRINADCFYGCEKLSKIDLPESITAIGSEAFKYSGLTEISIPDAVTEIWSYTFQNCKELGTVKLGANVKTIGSSAFGSCKKLSSITIPSSVRDIEYHAFSSSGVSNVIIEYGVQRLEGGVFYDCDNLTSITLPNSIYEVGDQVFGYCDALTKVRLSDNITNIPYGTFRFCNNLAEIILPANLEEIDSMAFTRTFNASGYYTRCYIYLRSTTPPTWLGSFQGTPYIYVPSGTKEVYEQDINWNRYDINEYEL